jgi:hypothetical protein
VVDTAGKQQLENPVGLILCYITEPGGAEDDPRAGVPRPAEDGAFDHRSRVPLCGSCCISLPPSVLPDGVFVARP